MSWGDGGQVWDASGLGHVRYSSLEAGAPSLGRVVENHVLQSSLHQLLKVRLNPHTCANRESACAVSWYSCVLKGCSETAMRERFLGGKMSVETCCIDLAMHFHLIFLFLVRVVVRLRCCRRIIHEGPPG